MHIYINRIPVQGAWGGGNKTVESLTRQLADLGHNVSNVMQLAQIIQNPHLMSTLNYDVIFCFDPRPNRENIRYEDLFLLKQHIGCKIIHRIGDIGTHGKPELYKLQKQTSEQSDYLIFPSHWAQQQLASKNQNYTVIKNRPKKIFYENRNTSNKLNDNIKLVTHHWSDNPKKGFAFYKELDRFIEDKNISFTYIGRVPKGYTLNNSTIIQPVGDQELSEMIPQHDIYVTASTEEAGANHVLEAMACGLPILYHKDGGSIPEYVGNRGLGYRNITEFIYAFNNMKLNFSKYKTKVLTYNENITQTIDEYTNIICNI